jgi:hypothetical protein
MRIPTWIILRHVPLEFGGAVQQIAAGIREVLGCDPNNKGANEPRFCVSILSNKEWEKSVTVSNAATNKKTTIIIDYDHLPIRCKFCMDPSHRVRNCPNREDSWGPRKGSSGAPNKKQTFPTRREPKSTTLVNQEVDTNKPTDQPMEMDGCSIKESKTAPIRWN